MQTLTEAALLRAPGGIFTRGQAACWVGAEGARLDGLVKRALASGEVWHLRRGVFGVARGLMRAAVDPFTVAQQLYGPSYVSLEAALWRHGWIPEAVHVVTCASLPRAKRFETPLGVFEFVRIPQRVFYAGVERVESDGGGVYLIARRLKALADMVYARRHAWEGLAPLVGSLRVEPEQLEELRVEEFEELDGVYENVRVRRFLAGLRKDLGL